jgi:hydrogenase-4 component J
MGDARVRFCSLNQKFVDKDEQIPDGAKEVMYYSLAIGHHVGVIDCLKTILEYPLDDYRLWIDKLDDGAAKRKLEGLFRFGEITVDRSHTQLLAQAMAAAKARFDQRELACTEILMKTLYAIESEPAIYVMIRRID